MHKGKYDVSFLVPNASLNLKEAIELIEKRGIFRAELDTYKYFGGIYFRIRAEGKSDIQCIAALINEIVNHPAFDPLWYLKDGRSRYEVCVSDDDGQSMKVIQKKFRVWAKNAKEAEKKIKKYNHFYEVKSVKQM